MGHLRPFLCGGFISVVALAIALFSSAPHSSSNASVCVPARPHAAGDSNEMIVSGGLTRDYILHVPPSYNGSDALPLVLNFHGHGSNGADQVAYTGLNAKADAAGFITATPQGLVTQNDSLPHWNAALAPPETGEPDDVGFVEDLINFLGLELCIDSNLVYSTGISNGAAMSVRLACSLSDRIAAIAPVAGVYWPPVVVDGPVVEPSGCPSATRPVPVIAFHGTDDLHWPFDGGIGVSGFDIRLSIEAALAEWATHENCGSVPQESQAASGVRLVRHVGCDHNALVELYAVEDADGDGPGTDGGGHTWPDATIDIPALGATTHEISANDLMWDFFVAHPLDAAAFTVDSIADGSDFSAGDGFCDTDDSVGDGPCTLRAAIEEANALSWTDTIQFDIIGAGPHTISPGSALPTITDPVIIDGTSEPDFVSTPIVELDGSGAGTDGLNITAGNSTVRGLVINNFSDDGIELSTNGGNTIETSFIGTDTTGTADEGNGGHGVRISGNDNVVGGPAPPSACQPEPCTQPATANVIAFNGGDGVFVDSGGSRNSIQANSIFDNIGQGIDIFPDGRTDLPWPGMMTSALYSNGRTVVTGFTHGAPSGVHLYVDVFVNPSCDLSTYGEGRIWIIGGDSTNPTTVPDGYLSGAVAPQTSSTVGDYMAVTVTVPDGTTYEFSKCVQVQPDTDNDTIADGIDGVLDGSTFVSQASTPSSLFTDEHLSGGTSFGTLAPAGTPGRNGCLVSTVSAEITAGPDQGRRIVVGADCPVGVGPATFSTCGGGLLTSVDRRESVRKYCSSDHTRVDFGPVEMTLGTITAILPTATASTVTDNGDGSYDVTNDAGSAASITLGGLEVAPGQTVTVQDSDGDGTVDSVDNCPAVATAWIVPVGDKDCDGWSSTDEGTIGTDPDVWCTTNPGTHDTWTVDPDIDGDNDIIDVLQIKPHFNSKKGNPDPSANPYNARFDWDHPPDGDVDIIDILQMKPFFNKSCT